MWFKSGEGLELAWKVRAPEGRTVVEELEGGGSFEVVASEEF